MGEADPEKENRKRRVGRSVFLNHDLGSLDHRRHGVSFFQLQFIRLRRVMTLSIRLSPTRTTTCAMTSPR